MKLLTFIPLFFSFALPYWRKSFPRKQLAMFQERKARPRRTTASFRLAMVALARFFDWRDALAIVKPETFLRWHRSAFKTFWRWKSRKPGRPALPKDLRELVRRMARENPTWGEERIANELSLKLGIRVAPRTVGKYLILDNPRGNSGQRCLRLFRVRDRFVVHDRDTIFSSYLDSELQGFGVRVLKTPVRAPKANAYCERLIGTIRRQCLDFLIPAGEAHLKRILREYVRHYNRGRPHSSLGPGIPERSQAKVPASVHRHKFPIGFRIKATSVLGGLHHEYGLEKEVA
jgi:hypothetical protein